MLTHKKEEFIWTRGEGVDRVRRRGTETAKESERVKPKYYYTCYNSLLFQWQGSWSEGDFITLQVIASYIKLGLPQFLGSTSVWLTVKLTALHHRVIRLACWLCIKQEQTARAALLRLPAKKPARDETGVYCTGRYTTDVKTSNLIMAVTMIICLAVCSDMNKWLYWLLITVE